RVFAGIVKSNPGVAVTMAFTYFLDDALGAEGLRTGGGFEDVVDIEAQGYEALGPSRRGDLVGVMVPLVGAANRGADRAGAENRPHDIVSERLARIKRLAGTLRETCAWHQEQHEKKQCRNQARIESLHNSIRRGAPHKGSLYNPVAC